MEDHHGRAARVALQGPEGIAHADGVDLDVDAQFLGQRAGDDFAGLIGVAAGRFRADDDPEVMRQFGRSGGAGEACSDGQPGGDADCLE